MPAHSARFDLDEIGTAANRAAGLIQERIDQEVDSLAWDIANIMVSAIDHLLTRPTATLEDVFVNAFGADPDDPAPVMTEYGMN